MKRIVEPSEINTVLTPRTIGGTLNKKVAVPDSQVSQVLQLMAQTQDGQDPQAQFVKKLVACAAEH